MSLLLEKSTDEGKKVLYAVAYENWKDQKAGTFYLLAKDRGDAVNQVLQSKMVQVTTKIVGIAPAVGMHYKELANGEVELEYRT